MKLIDFITLKEQEAVQNNLEKEAIKRILIDNVYDNLTNLVTSLNEEINYEKLNYFVSKYINDFLPPQYISGVTYFYGVKIFVDKNCLIPRSETEILVETTLKYLKPNSSVLEIGTGSGCISIALKKIMTNLTISASDISKKCLEISKKNAIINHVDINFIESDLFSSINSKFDYIISNPPYISLNEEIEKIVYDNEPHLALFSKNDGLYFYQEIIKNSINYLNKNGVMIFEIGCNQKESIKKLTEDTYPKSEVITYKDYNNLDRVVVIKTNKEV